ncbi:hypothetical protein ABZP36_022237, partial [Zizania latifolia]
VVVRIRPPCRVEEEEAGEDGRASEVCVRKTATNSVAIQGQDFTFEASTQSQKRPPLRLCSSSAYL